MGLQHRVWLQFELLCDDPKNIVLMMPPSLHYSLEEDPKRDEKVGKYLRDGLLGYGDDKVRLNIVWEEGVYLVKFVSSEVCMDKGICKSRTSRSPRSA